MNQESCESQADRMSCMTQIFLAKREAEELMRMQNYYLLDPSCERYHSMMDRGLEHRVQRPDWLSKHQDCFRRLDEHQKGPWSDQFDGRRFERFEQWTRAKGGGAPFPNCKK